jgi:hypothetical protein
MSEYEPSAPAKATAFMIIEDLVSKLYLLQDAQKFVCKVGDFAKTRNTEAAEKSLLAATAVLD